MSFGDQLGTVSLIVGLFGIAAFYLWPTKKWIGWMSLIAAVVIALLWGFFAFRATHSTGKETSQAETSKPAPSSEPGQPHPTPRDTNHPSSTPRPKAPIKSKPDEAPPPVTLPKTLVQLSAVFKNPSSLSLAVFNPSDDVAENVSWAMVAFRTSDLAFFGFATQSIGYVKPHMESANYFMELATMQKSTDGDGQIKEGDELTGSVSIDCPRCTIRAYIVHVVWKREGWYFESPVQGGYVVPKEGTKEGRAKYIQELTGEGYANQRIAIKPQ
jgi:hypothetical protein